ncbi:MAG: hypothetical protein AAFR81_08275 [Chloroflexota bacterium]
MISEKDALLIAEKDMDDWQENFKEILEAKGYTFIEFEWHLEQTYHTDDEWEFMFEFIGDNSHIDPSFRTVTVHKETGEVRHR